jgi:hypothetical protein
MKKSCLLLLISFISLEISAQNWIWGRGASAGGAEGYDVCTDQSGNSCLVGSYNGNGLTFGSQPIFNSNNGTLDFFIVKYDNAGNVMWAKDGGDTGAESAYSVIADDSGNFYATGSFTSLNFSLGNNNLNCQGQSDIFIVKYNSQGNVIWARSAGNMGSEEGKAITFDHFTSSVIVTGFYNSSSLSFGPYTVNGNGNKNIFAVKYDAGGAVMWAKSGNGINDDIGFGIASDNSGNVFITGYMQSQTLTFGTTIINSSVSSPKSFLVKLDATGNSIWGTCAGLYGAIGHDVATDLNGDVIITGNYDSTIIFGSTTLYCGSNTNNKECFVSKYDSSGNNLWAKTSKCTYLPLSNSAFSITTDHSGSILISGGGVDIFQISFDMDTLNFTSSAPDPMYIVKFSPSGNVICVSGLTSGGDDQNSIATDSIGNIYIGGDFISNPFAIGPDTLYNSAGETPFVAKYNCELMSLSTSSDILNSIKVYPNPSNGDFNLDFEKNIPKDSEILITDVLGNAIYQSVLENSVTPLHLSENGPGIYFYLLTNKNRMIGTGKLIIQ